MQLKANDVAEIFSVEVVSFTASLSYVSILKFYWGSVVRF